MDPYIGKVLNDRYEIQSLIGQGSTAVVYKAHCRRLDRTVAIKILNEELSNDENLLAKFYEESSKVAALSQANIVDIFDINQHQNIHYVVMEYLDGISLKQFISYKRLLTWNETIYFSIQILKALEYAHAHGVVHHDLKPQNVMILRDGSVKVTDFAIAHLSTSQSTMSRSQLDSTYYLSPEQTNGGTVETRSDLYSLGIMMYEMLTGKVPYSGTSSVSVAVQHVQGGAIPPRQLQPNIPIGLQQITLHAMNSDIRYRYNTAYGMKKDLETLQQNPRVGFRFKEPVIQEVPTPVAAEPEALASEAAVPENIPEDEVPDIAVEEITLLSEVPVQEAPAEAAETAYESVNADTASENLAGANDTEPDQLTETDPSETNDSVSNENVSDESASDSELNMQETDAADPDAFEAPAPDEEPAADSEVEKAARAVEEELFNTGDLDTDFSGLWEQFSQKNDDVSVNEDAASNEDYDADEYAASDDYDEDDEYDYDDEGHHSIAPIIIIILIILILAVVGFFFRSTIAEYAVKFWNMMKDFLHNL